MKLADPNQEAKERVLKILDGSAPPEVSATVADYRASIANSKSVCRIDKTVADQLSSAASSFHKQCAQAIEDMNKSYHEKMMKKKPVGKDDSELSIREIWETECGGKYNLSGWALAPYDPNKLIAFFACLQIQKGYHLESYHGQDQSGNGRAYVFAIPENRNLPRIPPRKVLDDILSADMEEDEDPIHASYFSKAFSSILGILLPTYRPLPKWADRNIESYLEGDGTPLSYFQASLYLREIYELGARWHCAYWSHHKFVTAPQKAPVEEWTWYEPEPEEWDPVVWKDRNEKWNVAFYTIDSMGADLVFHNDTFISGYEFETFSTNIAHYPGGYEV
jgi:hypothetical protein